MQHPLEIADVYHTWQKMGGFFGARLKAFRDYLDLSKVHRIFDIGCGPGHIIKYIPERIDYIGFDINSRYIASANRRFGSRGHFVLRAFDRSAAADYGQPDLIIMNGVLHHMDNVCARLTLENIAAVLPDQGVFFGLDGCYRVGQNPISRYLLQNDRGQFVRTALEYQKLVNSVFPRTEVFVREDLSWIPYTFAITCAYKNISSRNR